MNKNFNRAFDHVFIIMFENQYRSYVMENEYFRGLSRQGIDMANYFGVMHPSQTNYISSLAAELCNVTDDDRPKTLLPQDTMVDLIEKSPYNLDWKAYMDSYIPQNQAWSKNMVPKDEFPYMIKHNAFSSFAKIVRNEERWNKIQNEATLFSDLLNGTLPAYSWFTPNMWNDGHYVDGTNPLVTPPIGKQPAERAPTLVDQAAEWLEGFFERLKFPGPDSHFPPNTLVVVTYDEADFEASYDPKTSRKYYYDGPNQIYTVLLGDMITPGGVAYEGYNHYSLIKTIEYNFGLDNLGKNDKDANWFKFLWDETYIWEAPEETPIQTAGNMASAGLDEALYLAYNAGEGEIHYTVMDGENWSQPKSVGICTSGAMAMANLNNRLVLAYCDDKHQLAVISYTLETGWSKPDVILKNARKVTLAAIDNESKLMLVYAQKDDDLQYLTSENGIKWSNKKAIHKHKATGDIQLAVLGPSVFLIFQDKSYENQLMVCSYNTADFNVVKLEKTQYNGPQSNTTKDKWSPSVYPVQHFSSAFLPNTPKAAAHEKEPVSTPYLGAGPLAAATLDGVLHLAHPGVGNNLMLTEEFSIHGTMTPELPISYDPKKTATTNTGYGTLAEAGWSEQNPIHGAFVATTSTMTSVNGEVVLIYDNEEGYVDMVRGGY